MDSIPFQVSIEYPFYQSTKGFYFIGQTPILEGQSGNALASLCNPSGSTRLLFVNAITITNPSDSTLFAEFYLGTKSNSGEKSSLITCTNTAITPIPVPIGMIEYFSPPAPQPGNGVSIFSRIVSPQSTLVVDGGQIILGENQSLSVYIGGFAPVPFETIRFAFGWSEKECYSCN